jgi:hypothetical protein
LAGIANVENSQFSMVNADPNTVLVSALHLSLGCAFMNVSPVIASLLFTSLALADYPVAKVLTNPGAEYADTLRSWQGIPGIERASNGRLWVTW